MRRITIPLLFIFVVTILVAGYQLGKCEVANIELRDELDDMASQLGARSGLAAPTSDEDLRKAVIRSAQKYDIELAPSQIMVQRTRIQNGETLLLQADYNTQVQLPGLSFKLHFTPASGTKTFRYSTP